MARYLFSIAIGASLGIVVLAVASHIILEIADGRLVHI